MAKGGLVWRSRGESELQTSEPKPHWNHRFSSVLRFRSSSARMLHDETNFGIGTLDADRDRRAGPDGREYRPAADAQRAPMRGVRRQSRRQPGARARRRDLIGGAAGPGEAAEGAAHGLADAAGGRGDRDGDRRTVRPARRGRHHHRRRQQLLEGRHRARRARCASAASIISMSAPAAACGGSSAATA